MFDRVAPRYDLLNDLISLGLDRYWRRATAASVRPRPRGWVLDLGCGTGRLGARLAGQARVVGLDLSRPMLARARHLSLAVRPVEATAMRLPFRDEAFDAVVSAFVLRNLSDLRGAFAEVARVLAPGGQVALCDITGPTHPLLRRAFHLYFGSVAPAAGALVGRGDAYRYLVRSLAHLPPPPEVCALLAQAGLRDCRARPLTGGIVTLFTARR
jgi:demethylmenaquinone methyltransferase/2-methoxy-6-polyprenyl-1,4-benzoquinol methylase